MREFKCEGCQEVLIAAMEHVSQCGMLDQEGMCQSCGDDALMEPEEENEK
jgi:hypothetical protein